MRTPFAVDSGMAIVLIILVLGGFLVLTVGGAYSPAVIVIAAAALVGYFIVWRAKRKRGSTAKL